MLNDKQLTEILQAGEREWIARVVADLLDDQVKLVYADWLEERGDVRCAFLRKYVAASRSMILSDFPPTTGIAESWLELIGFRLLEKVVAESLPELKEPVLRLARPAMRLKKVASDDDQIAIGASKIGGLPDLPADCPWPPGGDCKAIYNDDTGGTDRLAGFLCQINLAEVSSSPAAKDLPPSGLLSFFCFQDIENDNPDAIGARALLFADTSKLVRTHPPRELTEGNDLIPAHVLVFEETLDLPESYEGPWSDQLKPIPNKDYGPVLDYFRALNFENFLGYARATTGSDPTPSTKSRHLIILENSVGCRLHIQLSEENLLAHNFDEITLDWVDFD